MYGGVRVRVRDHRRSAKGISNMDKTKLLVEAKTELERHVWRTFVEGKATVALGG
jgi:hypothetical protein